MRDHQSDVASPDRPRRLPSHRPLSPSNSYCDTTAAMIEPISPKQEFRRSLRIDESTYDILTGKTEMPVFHASGGGIQSTSPKRIGSSCPYCRLGVGEHKCSSGPVNKGNLPSTAPQAVSTERKPTNKECVPIPADEISSVEKQGDETTEENSMLPTVSVGGITYYPEEVLAEGWLQKKGTGQDWLGSRGWKARWARLCMASTSVSEDCQDENRNEEFTSPDSMKHLVQVTASPIAPILLLYWFPTSTAVSTVIVLDSTVVLGMDLEDKTHVNPYRFEIRHATSQENATLPNATRVFAAPKRERDAWVYAISQALLTYAKAKEKARKLQELQQHMQKATISPHSSPFVLPRVSPRGAVLGMEEDFPWNRLSPLSDRGAVTIARERALAPPLSPTMPKRRLSLQKPSPLTRSSSTPSPLVN